MVRLVDDMHEAAENACDMSVDIRARIRMAAPMGRQGLPSELAASISFLAGADSSFMTGQTLNVDGGAHMS